MDPAERLVRPLYQGTRKRLTRSAFPPLLLTICNRGFVRLSLGVGQASKGTLWMATFLAESPERRRSPEDSIARISNGSHTVWIDTRTPRKSSPSSSRPCRSSGPSPPCWTASTTPSRAPRRSSPPPRRLRDALLHDLLTRGLPGQHTEWRDVPGLGTIPADWEVVRLGDVATVRNGTTPSRRKSEYWGNEGIPFVKTGQVNDLYITEPEEFITHEAVENAGPGIVPEGSVLIAMIGQGKTRGMTAKLGFRAAINQNFAAVYDPLSGFDLNFFFAWASQNYALIRALGQGSNQDALNCEVIQGMKFPLPPPAEQRTIAAALDGADAAIEVARAEFNGLRCLKESASDALLTGRVRVALNFRPTVGDCLVQGT